MQEEDGYSKGERWEVSLYFFTPSFVWSSLSCKQRPKGLYPIIILTETKFKSSDMDIYKQEWNSGMLMSCTPEPRAQAGVAILFRKGLAIDIIVEGKDKKCSKVDPKMR